jgi:hypothetical protein
MPSTEESWFTICERAIPAVSVYTLCAHITAYPGIKLRVVSELSGSATLDRSSFVEYVMYRRGNEFTTHGKTMMIVLTNVDGKLAGNAPKSSTITIPNDGEI